jgi:hypothetical protein
VLLLRGVNFVVIKLGLLGVSPFVPGGLRMLATAVPAVFPSRDRNLPLAATFWPRILSPPPS